MAHNNGRGSVNLVEKWLPGASTDDATYLIAGGVREGARRSTRGATVPVPAAPEPMSSDDELEEFDPFSEENVPRAANGPNNAAIRAIFKLRFDGCEAPKQATAQSKLHGGQFLDYLRQCIIANAYP